MKKLVDFAQDLVKSALGVRFDVIPCSSQEMMKYIHVNFGQSFAEVIFSREEFYKILYSDSPCIYEIHFKYGICSIAFKETESDTLWILGPALCERISEIYIRTNLHSQYGLDSEAVQEVVDFISRLPEIPISVLGKTMASVVSHTTSVSEVTEYERVDLSDTVEVQPPAPMYERYEDAERIKKVEKRYELSAALTEAVKHGNFSLAVKLLGEFSADDTDVRNSNPLRNSQNYCIVLNSQLRYALENSGIHPYRLDRFSSKIAESIEKIKSISEVNDFIFETIKGYCNLSQEEILSKYKPTVKLAVAYVKEHLSDNLTVKGTANELLVNPDYLSSEFHVETGMTFIDFVNKERVSLAASLLKRTNLQIQQIATAVGYNNTSYFSKLFKKFLGMTPQEFRNK